MAIEFEKYDPEKHGAKIRHGAGPEWERLVEMAREHEVFLPHTGKSDWGYWRQGLSGRARPFIRKDERLVTQAVSDKSGVVVRVLPK